MNDSRITPPRALITGATGYVGSSLAARLHREGWEVHVVTRAGSSLDALASLPGLVVHQHDGTTSGMIELVGKANPGVVFHLASLFLAQHQPQDVDALIRSNVLFSTQLAEAMAANGVRYLVNTGTSWQHFENQAYNPVNLYAATKQAFEDILAYYADAGMLKVTTLALFDTYGPNDPRRKLVALLRDLVRTGQSLAMSPGEQLIDLVHIDDVLDAFMLAAQRLPAQPVAYARYGVSSGTPMTLREFVAVFERATGARLAIEWGGRTYRPREVMTPWQAPAMEGWQARIRLEDGLRTIESPDVG